jgi:hypothetical protein
VCYAIDQPNVACLGGYRQARTQILLHVLSPFENQEGCPPLPSHCGRG